MSEGSRIFSGYRTLGLVSNHVPHLSRYIARRQESLIVTCVGKMFQTYGTHKLNLMSVSKGHKDDITAMAADTYLVYTAAGCDIFGWIRGHELKSEFKGHKHTVHLLMPLGPQLISVDVESNLKVWDVKSREVVHDLPFSNDAFEVTCLMHPATYVNKILLGSKQGPLQLWNIRTLKQIYTFVDGFDSEVMCMAQAPAVDVVAIGQRSGVILVHNLKLDHTIVKFTQDWGAVTSLSFRTDGPPLLISGSQFGHLAQWNLEKQCLASQTHNAHNEAITGLSCLPSEPIVVTSSPDNSLKQWICDMADGGCRMLRVQEGQGADANRIKFFGDNDILCASQDSSLRSFSTINDLLNKSFGVASHNRKLSKKHAKMANPAKMRPITDFSAEQSRDGDWANIACVHDRSHVVSTWSFRQQRMCDLTLREEINKEGKRDEKKDPKKNYATSVCVSACGNFVFVGHINGAVHKYNLQSGINRGSFVVRAKGSKATKEVSIRGLASDSLNQVLVTADDKGQVMFWPFNKALKPLGRLQAGSGITLVNLNRSNNMLALATSDFEIIVVDVISRERVRSMPEAHSNNITDLTFSPDGRWLLTASLDKSVKVFDMITGQVIDHFCFRKAVISMCLNTHFLATVHVGQRGIRLWANKTIFKVVGLKALPEEFQPCNLDDYFEDKNVEDDNGIVDDEMPEEFVSPDQLSRQLVTLSLLPESRWKSLRVLDAIKSRNKASEVQRPKEPAPFFLPTSHTSSTSIKFDFGPKDNEKDKEDSSKLVSNASSLLTNFGRRLMSAENDDDFEHLFTTLKEMNPSNIDLELLKLVNNTSPTTDCLVVTQFLRLILLKLKSRVDFEVAQAYLGLLLKHHGDVVALVEKDVLQEVLDEVQKGWSQLKKALVSSTALLNFYRTHAVS